MKAPQGRLLSVHPRGCGEHLVNWLTPDRVTGSSPRVRGTRVDPDAVPILQRFIPAGAGNTTVSVTPSGEVTVHPRGCGEHFFPTRLIPAESGSSPRVRGTRIRGLLRGIYTRFIPAGAGNTSIMRCGSASGPVHPRGCGEHRRSRSKAAGGRGSSPRVRGTPMRIRHMPV